jgi:fatty-acyl-CoA synthase
MDFVQFDPAAAVVHWGRYRPKAPALVCNGQEISYAALDAATAEIAESLRDFAVEERIAVLSKSKIELLKLIIGVRRTDRPVIVLNPTLPREALLTNLRDSRAGALLHTEHEDAENLKNEVQANSQPGRVGSLSVESAASAVWAIIFSSGSTGTPKGIERDRHSIVVETLGWCLELGLNRHTSFYVGRPLFYTGGFVLALSTLLAGGTVVLGECDDTDARAAWSDYQNNAAQRKLDWAFFVPDQIRQFMRFADASDATKLLAADQVLVMGALISGDEKIRARATLRSQIVESWGNSESLGTVTDPEDLDRRPKSVGRPFLNDRLFIVDESGNTLPPGQTGRLAGGREAGFLAYSGRPVETARTFKNDLIVSEDLGYMDEAGYFYVLGRVQDAVLIGNRTVLLTEIENDLRAIEYVEDCCVVALPAEAHGVELTCLVVSVSDDTGHIEKIEVKIRSRLQREAPVSTRVVWAKTLPRTASGKTDKLAVARILSL